MRVFLAIILGCIGGFLLGIALSSFIAILGIGLWNTPIEIKFLPYYVAIICAIVVPVIDQKTRKK